MKRIAILILMLWPMHLQAELRAGAAASNISPPLGIPLDGAISQNGPATQIHDELHARCLVLESEGTALALAIVDSTMISDSIMEAARQRVETRTGIPAGHVIIAATHTHSTPRALVGLVKDDPVFDQYLEDLSVGIADGIERAFRQLAPAEVGWMSVEVPDHVHNRRWFVEIEKRQMSPFGGEPERVRMNPGREGLVRPAGPVDPELQILAVRHRDGQPLAVLGNYGLHYVGGGKRGEISADYFAIFADRMQQLLEADRQQPAFVGMLSNGTSGDVNAIDFSAPAVKYAPRENMQRIARDLAEKAHAAMDEMEWERGITLAAASETLDLGVRKPDAELLKWAEEVAAPEGTPLRLSRVQVYARETLALSQYPDTVPVLLRAFRIGDLGVVSIPCEVFARTGLEIKEGSPFPRTMVLELANGYHGYLPDAQQHEWGGYETWAARSSYLEVNAEEKIRTASLRLLEALHAELP